MSDILKMKGARQAIDRILKAVADKEKIILFGDADPDGVAAVIILKESLEILKNPAQDIYFPNFEKESYGLNKKALTYLKKYAPGLLIILDCGITNVQEVEKAKKLGFEVIIIDHHEPLKQLPDCIIIDPKQKDCQYPFKELCAAVIVYNLTKKLVFEAQKTFKPERFLELAMIATLYDSMPLIGQNKEIVEQGLLCLSNTDCIGMKSLIEITECEASLQKEVQEKIVPILGAADVKKHINQTFSLLTENSPLKAKNICKNLLKKRKIKQKKVKQALIEINQKIDNFSNIIFEGDSGWQIKILGAIASRICGKYKKPCFIYHKGEKQSRGAVRSIKDIDSVKMMTKCSHLLKSYGGHAKASGFCLNNENLSEFKKCLIKSI